MAMQITHLIKELKLSQKEFLKRELKANRKRNGKWQEISHYPISSQVVAFRLIAPRGYQDKWATGEIDTYIPTKNGFKLTKLK